jgi:hypothetical protein
MSLNQVFLFMNAIAKEKAELIAISGMSNMTGLVNG